MMDFKKGVFISDIHLPDHIDLKPLLKYMKDLKPDYVIFGGDIIDAKGMHGVESMSASQIKLSWYDRDKELMLDLLRDVKKVCSKSAKIVFLEGNHEQRYRRVTSRYPDAFGGRFDFNRDCLQAVFPGSKWVSYGDYNSYYKLGDTIFKHGTVYPQNHAKAYAEVGSRAGMKTVYGHLHSFQAWTVHSDMPKIQPSRYAVTSGCLSTTEPEWKKGAPNMWINGFIDFVLHDGIVTPAAHIIEKGKFYIGGKEYK